MSALFSSSQIFRHIAKLSIYNHFKICYHEIREDKCNLRLRGVIMMNKTILMLSASCMSIIAGADWCCADFNHFDTSPSFIPAGVKSHVSTHTSHLTAGHLSSPEDFNKGDNKNIQLAAACFVTDTTNCSGNEFANADSDDNDGGVPPRGDDYDLDNAERCRQEGYTQTSCPEGQEPSNFCPYDSNYFEKCVSSCPSNYVTCEVPYYGVGEDCDGKYASCEKDTERACKEENPNYTNSCDYGQQLSDDRCSYDSSYGTCCNTCAGYPYTKDNIPEGYVQDGQSCIGCDGQEHYKIKPNPCDGFMDCGSMGPEIGAKSCQSGNQIKYDNCKPCPNLGSLTYCPAPFTCSYEDCSGLYYKTGCQPGYDWNQSSQTCTKQCAYECTYSNCPSPFTCRYEDCSGKYCKTGCQSGYDWNSSSQTCTKQCSADYQYTCTGTGYAGGSGTSCNGKYQSCICSSNYQWNGNGCSEVPEYQNECMKGTEIGYILYSDMTRSKNLTSGKTPIGIVVCSYENNTGGQAMALKTIGNLSWEKTSIWNSGKDIPELENLKSTGAAVMDIKSCNNTNIITNAGNSSQYPAAWATKDYSTAGTSAGDWCLPAAGIFRSIDYFLDLVNSGFSLVGGEKLGRASYLWSSTEMEYDNSNRSMFDSNLYGLYPGTKGSSYEVRPVIEF